MCLQRSSSFGMSDEILSVLYFQKLNNCDMMSYSIVLVQMSKLEEMFNFYKRSKAWGACNVYRLALDNTMR